MLEYRVLFTVKQCSPFSYCDPTLTLCVDAPAGPSVVWLGDEDSEGDGAVSV